MSEVYRKIVLSFWTDHDIRRLTLEQRALLLYFFTSPHSNMIGLYFLPIGYVLVETGIASEAVLSHLTGALSRFVTYDRETEEVFVHNMARYQITDVLKADDNRKLSVQRLLAKTASSRLRHQFLTRYAHWDLVVPTSTEAPPQGASIAAGEGALEGPHQAKAVAVAGAAAGAAAVTDSEHPRSPAGDDSGTADAPSRPAITPPETTGGGWPAEFAAMFEAIGQFNPGRVGRAISPVRRRYGPERTREMLAAFVQLAPHQRPDGSFDPEVQAHQFCTPERFAQTAAFWYQQTEPLADTVRV